jgi:uncharacterized protein (TIGR03067 family)
MKKLIPTCLILAAAVNLFAADTRDIKLLLGEWIPIKAELGGQAIPDAVLKAISLKLGQETYDVSVAGDPDKGIYEINSSTMPKSMLIKGTDGPNKGRTFPAIYEIDGGTLRICYDLSGAQHPKEFKSVAGTRLYLVTYQRKK